MEAPAAFARYLAIWNGEAPVYELPSLLAPNYLGHLGSDDRDVARLAEAITAYRARLPDVRFAIEHQFGEGEYMASRLTATATHPDTGQQAQLVGINVSRWLHGLLVEEWAVWETLA